MDPAPNPPDPSTVPSPSLAPGQPHSKSEPTSARAEEKSNRPFWIALGSITFPGLFALLGTDDAGAIAALLLAPLGSLVAGVLLGMRLGKQPVHQIFLSIALIPLCFVASESLAAAGCSLGGFRMNFQ